MADYMPEVKAGLGAMGNVLSAWGSGRSVEQVKSERESVSAQKRAREKAEREEGYIDEILKSSKNPDFDLRLDPTARKFAIEAPERFANVSQGYMLQKKGAASALADGVAKLKNIAEMGDAQSLIQGLASLKQGATNAGLPTPFIDQAIQNVGSGNPEQIEATLTALNGAYEKFDKAGHYPKPKFIKIEDGKALFDKGGKIVAQDIEGVDPDAMNREERTKFKEKVFDNIYKEVGETKKAANVLRTNFNKMTNLAEQIRKGDRSAVAQFGVALVKMGDPTSTVRDEELAMALKTGDFSSAAANWIKEGKISQSAADMFARALDPTNPNTIDVDGSLRTAQSLLKSNVPSLLSSYKSAKDRANNILTGKRLGQIFDEETEQAIQELDSLSIDEFLGNNEPTDEDLLKKYGVK